MNRIFIVLGLYNLLGAASVLANACGIDSLTVTVDHCQDTSFYAYISFDVGDGAAEGFEIAGNGEEYGVFSYDKLPIKLGPLSADGITHYEFVVRDRSDSTCRVVYDLGEVTCKQSCEITELVVRPDTCREDGQYDVEIDFSHSGFTHFDLYYNFEPIGYYHTSELPLTIQGITPSGAKKEAFKVCANDHGDCCKIMEVAMPSCESSCLQEVKIDVEYCDSSGLGIILDVEREGELADSFSVKGNGNYYGLFAYRDLPIKIGEISKELLLYEFVVTDKLDDHCSSVAILQAPCEASCNMDKLRAEVTSCEEGLFDAMIDFKPGQMQSDSFKVKGNGTYYGIYSYHDLPIRLEDLKANHEIFYEFVVVDAENSDCRSAVEIGTVDCQCRIDSLVVAHGDCTSDSTYVIEIDFQTTAFSAFDLFVNDEFFSSYQVTDLPLRMEDFPASGYSEDKLKLIAQGVDGCYVKTHIDAPACIVMDCGLHSLTVDQTDCAEGASYAWIDFRHDAHHSKYFYVKGNGHEYGKYSYESLPVKVGPLKSDEHGIYELIVQDREFSSCQLVAEGELNCAVSDCAFYDITTKVNACDEDQMFTFTLDFEIEGDLSDAFIVDVCEKKFVFKYADLPIEVGPFAGGETFYHFTLHDSLFACSAEAAIGRVICIDQCDFGAIETKVSACLDDSLYVLTILSVESDFQAFDVYLNDAYYGFYPKDALPMDLDVQRKGSGPDLLTICVSDNTTCCVSKEIFPEVCKEVTCEILDWKVDTIFCIRDSFMLQLDIVHEGDTDKFSIKGNGRVYGTFEYAKSPIRLGPFPLDETPYEFEARDLQKEDCSAIIELGQVQCSSKQAPQGQQLLIIESGSRQMHMRIADIVKEPTLLEIFDLQGRILYQLRFSSTSELVLLNIPELVGGMYVMRLQGMNGRSDVRKFIMH